MDDGDELAEEEADDERDEAVDDVDDMALANQPDARDDEEAEAELDAADEAAGLSDGTQRDEVWRILPRSLCFSSTNDGAPHCAALTSVSTALTLAR